MPPRELKHSKRTERGFGRTKGNLFAVIDELLALGRTEAFEAVGSGEAHHGEDG